MREIQTALFVETMVVRNPKIFRKFNLEWENQDRILFYIVAKGEQSPLLGHKEDLLPFHSGGVFSVQVGGHLLISNVLDSWPHVDTPVDRDDPGWFVHLPVPRTSLAEPVLCFLFEVEYRSFAVVAFVPF